MTDRGYQVKKAEEMDAAERLAYIKALEAKVLEGFVGSTTAREGGQKMADELTSDTVARTVNQEAGAVEHERVAQPEVNLGREREYETGSDEMWKGDTGEIAKAFRQKILDAVGRNRSNFDVVSALIHNRMAQMTEFNGVLNSIAGRYLSNAATVEHLMQLRSAHHADIATNAQWNMPETGLAFTDALKAGQNATTAQKSLDVAIAEAVQAGIVSAFAQLGIVLGSAASEKTSG